MAERYGHLATVFRPSPRLYGAGPPAAVTLPLETTFSRRGGCTTVVALGAVSTAFALALAGDDDDDDQSDQIASSVAGLAQMTRCGASRAELAELTLDVRSPHAVVEWIVATAPSPLPSARSLLPNRDPGVVQPLVRPGPPPDPGPVADRVLRLETRLAREELTSVERRVGTADASGAGRLLIELTPGCHRMTVFGAPATAPSDDDYHDIDAELAWGSGGVASVDRTESPDASLIACTAERELGILAFAGAGKGGAVIVVHAQTGLPESVPARWGVARARLARTLLERRIPGPTGPAVYESLGVAGITVLPLELTPGQCYLAAASSLQGDVKLLALNAFAYGPATQAHVDDTDQAAVVTFCAGAASRGRLEVEVHGSSPIWLAAVWPAGQRRLGEETP
ncbi:MAG TPA: hypothetical protein VH062_19645 [Polyangiaceae bacterium]|nr:hypothetical protein [Polyangiaceae bacterium]